MMSSNAPESEDAARFEVRFLITAEDSHTAMLAASDFSKPAYRRRLTTTIFIRAAMLALGTLLVISDKSAWYGWLMIGYGLSGMLTWGPILAFPKRQIQKRVRMLGLTDIETDSIVTMDGEKVSCSTKNLTLMLGWGIIDAVDIDPSCLRFVSKHGVIQVPSSAFDSDASRQSFTKAAIRYHSTAAVA